MPSPVPSRALSPISSGSTEKHDTPTYCPCDRLRPASAVSCACAIHEAVKALEIAVRIGVHAGEVEYDGEALIGLTIHIGSRVTGVASPGEVLVSSTVRDLVAGSGITFTDRGTHILRGIPGEWRLFTPDVPEVGVRPS